MSWNYSTSLTEDEAQDLQSEHAQSDSVVDARIVTFLGNTHVHLDLDNGDIAVINGSDSVTFS